MPQSSFDWLSGAVAAASEAMQHRGLRLDWRPNPPTTKERLEAVEGRLHAPLPTSLRDFFLTQCNGATIYHEFRADFCIDGSRSEYGVGGGEQRIFSVEEIESETASIRAPYEVQSLSVAPEFRSEFRWGDMLIFSDDREGSWLLLSRQGMDREPRVLAADNAAVPEMWREYEIATCFDDWLQKMWSAPLRGKSVDFWIDRPLDSRS